MAIQVTITGVENIVHNEEITLGTTIIDTDTGEFPEGTVRRQWSVPSSKGRFIGSTTGSQVTYLSDIPGNDATTAEITCTVTVSEEILRDPGRTGSQREANAEAFGITEVDANFTCRVNIITSGERTGQRDCFNYAGDRGFTIDDEENITITDLRWPTFDPEFGSSGHNENFVENDIQIITNRIDVFLILEGAFHAPDLYIIIPTGQLIPFGALDNDLYDTSRDNLEHIDPDYPDLNTLIRTLSFRNFGAYNVLNDFTEDNDYIQIIIGSDDAIYETSESGSGSATLNISPNQNPIIVITAPSSVFTGSRTDLSADITDPEDNPIESIIWTTTLGTLENTTTANPTLFAGNTEGTATITCRATDSSDATGSATTTITIEQDNEPPTVELNLPSDSVFTNSRTNISATITDPDNDPIESIEWETTLGTLEDADTTTPTFVTDNRVGTATITCTATDSNGASTTATGTITVIPNHPPIIVITAPSEVFTGSRTGISAEITDPEDDEISSIEWTTTLGTLENADTAAPTFIAGSTAGTATITCTATDSNQNSTTETIQITINEVPLQIEFVGPTSIRHGQEIQITANVTDDDDMVPESTILYNWSVPTGQGRIIGPTNEQTITYIADIPGNNPTTAIITCRINEQTILTYLIDSNTNNAIAYDNRNRVSADDIRLPSGTWRGAFTTPNRIYFIDNNADRAIAYNHNRNRVSADDIDLGSGGWQGGFTTPNRIYIIDNANDIAIAYDHNRNRVSADDIDLGSGTWRAGFATPDRIYFIDDSNNTAIAFHYNRDRASEDDINLGSGTWQGGFTTPDRIYIIDDSNNTAIAFHYNRDRASEDDINLGNGTWQGALAVEILRNFQSNTHTINIEPNQPPIISTIFPFSVSTGSRTQLNAIITDPEDDEIESIIWTTTLGTLEDADTATPTFVTSNVAGTAAITCTATDSNGGSASITGFIIITTNQPPVIVITAPSEVLTGSRTELSTEITDPEGHAITLIEWTTNLGTLQNINTTIPIFIAGNVEGTATITCQATDSGGAIGSATTNITIQRENQPPTIQLNLPDTVSTNTTTELSAEITDPEDDAIESIIWTTTLGTLENANTVTPTFIAGSTAGTTAITCTATDSNQNSTTVTEFIIITANLPPIIVITGPSEIFTGSSTELNSTITDPENDEIESIRWTTTLGTLENATTTTPTFIAGNIEGTATITCEATDSSGKTGSTTTNITIQRENQPPTIQFNIPSNIPINTPTELSATITDPEDDAIESIIWTTTLGTLENADTTIPILTPGNIAGTATITCTATDSNQNSTTETIEITITETPLQVTFVSPATTPHSQNIQITAHVINTNTGMTPETTISYNWSVPTDQGHIVGPTNEQTITYVSDIPGNDPTEVNITCEVSTAGHITEFTTLNINTLDDLESEGIIVNMVFDADLSLDATLLFSPFSTTLHTGSDIQIEENLTIGWLWWDQSGNLFGMTRGGSGSMEDYWSEQANRDGKSLVIIHENGEIIEIPASNLNSSSTSTAWFSAAGIPHSILDTIMSGDGLAFGIVDTGSTGIPGEEITPQELTAVHRITVTPNAAPIVTLSIPSNLQAGTSAEIIANIEDTEEEEIERVEWSVEPEEIGTFDTPIVLNPDKVIGENYVNIITNFNVADGQTGIARITCTATDSDGQVGTAVSNINIRSSTIPTITFITTSIHDSGSALDSNEVIPITSGTTTDIEIEVTGDDTTVDIIWRLINGNTGEITSAPFNPAYQQVYISANRTIIVSFTAPLETGIYQVQVEVIDSFGNIITEELTIEIISQASGIQQFFTNNNNILTQEWTERNRIFQGEIFTTTANTKVQRVWIRNSNRLTANITVSVHPDVQPPSRRDWITFGQNPTNITDHTRELTLEEGEIESYYVKIEVPPEQLNAPNAPEVFPLEDLEFELAATEEGIRIIGADTQAEFEAGHYDEDDIHYHNGALRRVRTPPAQLHTEWNNTYEVVNLVPFNIHGVNAIDNTPDIPDESDDPSIIYTINLQDQNEITQSRIRIIQEHTGREIEWDSTGGENYTDITLAQLRAISFSWQHIQINITLRDSGQVSGLLSDTAANPLTPWVQAIYITLLTTEVRTVTFQSYISFQALGAVDTDARLPEGIIILNKDDVPTAVPTNIIESFTFSYSRAGGNNNFNLKLRADWDQALNIKYDYAVIYVLNGEVQYRGIIDKIRTQLGTPESIEMSGAGLSKQLSHIQVTHKFNNETPQDMLIALFDKYISGPYTPLIFYNRDNIDNKNTTTSFNFKNENLYDVINKIAGAAGANPTGRGDTGTDIIWGVDENSQFYFLRKVNALRYQFHTGKNITFDDAKEAPKFNSVKFIGSTEGYDLENFIPDGSCELGNGPNLIPSTFDPQIWSTGPNVPIKIVRDTDHVKNGSQAYQFPITHDDSTDTDTSFRTSSHKVPNNIALNLSFYARCEARADVRLQLEIGIRQTYSEDDSDTQFYLYNIPLTSELQQFHIKDIDPLKEPTHITRHIALRFRALQKKPNEAITLDEIHLYRATADLPEPVGTSNIIAIPGAIKVVEPTPEGIKEEEIPTQPEPKPETQTYKREVFASDGEYEITITDLTELKEFGRHKQALQEVDSIKTLDEAYQYGRALLGANANEARRSSLKVTNNELSFKPYDNNEIKWGYTQIFGSVNPETRYQYAIVSVEHEWVNEQINSTIQIGAPRSTIPEVVRQLTARDRYRGDTEKSSGRGGDGVAISGGSISGGTTLSPIFSERTMPTQDDIRDTRASSDKDPVWIVGNDQRYLIQNGQVDAIDNQEEIDIRAVKDDYLDVRDTLLPTTYSQSRRHPFTAGTILKILSTTQMDVIFAPKHEHELPDHEHDELADHEHPLPSHDHELPDYIKALPYHSHEFIQHSHPLPDHEHAHSHPHNHPLIDHDHPLTEHDHDLPDYLQELPYHTHEFVQHSHPLPEHEHDEFADHEHPLPEHSHPLPDHEHDEFVEHSHPLPDHEHDLPEHIHQLPYHAHEPSETLPGGGGETGS